MAIFHLGKNFVLANALATLFSIAWAEPVLPENGAIVVGQGVINQAGMVMTITQGTPQMAVNWQNFDIAAGHSVIFNQPSASAVALNRVLGGNRSEIYGRLSSNGQVFLLNPNGVLFGKSAEVSVGSLLVSNKFLSDEDFLAGRWFLSGMGQGALINQGSLTALPGGAIVLAGDVLQNSGTISAEHGRVALAAAGEITLSLDKNGVLQVAVDGQTINALIENSGLISADGGQVLLTARGREALQAEVMNLTGIVRAQSIDGKSSSINVDGGKSGQVALNDAHLSVSGLKNNTSGGEISLLGQSIVINGTTKLDARGATGGGKVLVGGDYQGQNTTLWPHANQVFLGSAAAIDASATEVGHGGKIILWSDHATRSYGQLAARGGKNLGNGGFVEVSSKKWLAFHSKVDTLAPHGTAGLLLLDPTDITITGGTQDGSADGSNTFSGAPSGAAGTISSADTGPSTIYESELEGIAATTNISVQATNNISIAGTFTNGLSFAQTSGNSVTLDAGNSINASIVDLSTAGGALTLKAGSGGVTSSGVINTNGGLLTIDSSGASTLSGEISGSGGMKTKGSGTVTLSSANTFTGPLTILQGVSSPATASVTLSPTSSLATTQINIGDASIAADNTYAVLQTQANNQISNASITFSGGANKGAYFQMLGTNQSLVGINDSTGHGVIENVDTQSGYNTDATLTLTGAANSSYSGYLRDKNASISTGKLALVKNGAGTLTFSGSNIGYTGTTTVNAGILAFQMPIDGNYTAPSGDKIINNGGTLRVNGSNQSTQYYQTSLYKNTINAGGVFDLVSSRANSNGWHLLNYNNTFSGEGTIQVSSGSWSIWPSGSINPVSDFSGTFDIKNAAFLHGNSQGVGLVTNGATVNIESGGTLDLRQGSFSIGALNGSGTVTKSSSVSPATNFQVGQNNKSSTFSGVLESPNAYTLEKIGTGTLTLTGANTYTGTITINAGTLQIGNGGTSGQVNSSTIINDSHLIFNRSNALTLGGTISGVGDITITSGDLTLNGAINLAGAFSTFTSTVTGNTTLNGTLNIAEGIALSSTGNITTNGVIFSANGNITLTAGSDDTVSSNSIANGSVTGGDVTLNAAVTPNLSTKTVTIYSGNATTSSYTARVAGSASSMNKAYSKAAGGGSVDSSKKLNAFYRVTPNITVNGIAADNKVYDATSNATINVSSAAYSGEIDGDTINPGSFTITAPSGTFADANVGSGKVVNLNFGVTRNSAATNLADYAIVKQTTTTGNITPAALTVTALFDAKLLTQADSTNFSGVSYSGLVGGETSAVIGGTLAISRSNAGTESAGIYTGVLVPSGLTSNNYAITYANGDFRILPIAELLVKFQNASYVYGSEAPYTITSVQYMDNGNVLRNLTQTAANGNTYTYSDGLGGSITFTVAPSGSNSYSSSNRIKVGNHTLTGANQNIVGSNFTAVNFSGIHNVSPKILSIPTGGVNKIYDGTNTISGPNINASGIISGDIATPTASGSFISKNAGTGLAYSIPTLSLSGADATNYFFSGPSISGSDGVITSKEITGMTGIIAQNKIYDGTAFAQINTTGASVVGHIAGDVLTISSANGMFDNKHMGIDKNVAITSVTFGGADAVNYTYTTNMANTKANITPKIITATGVTGQNKVYDGTLNAMLDTSGASLSGVISGDILALAGGTGSFTSKQVGNGKIVNVTNVGLSGADAANYVALSSTATTIADITPKFVTLADLSVFDKTYDGNTRALFALDSATIVGKVAGDNLTLAGVSANFSDSTPGTTKTVVFNGLSLVGADANNYQIAFAPSGSASILAAGLPTFNPPRTIYDITKMVAQRKPEISNLAEKLAAARHPDMSVGSQQINTLTRINKPPVIFQNTISPYNINITNTDTD